MNYKDIQINGVTLRLFKMSPFDQYDIINTLIPSLSGVLRAVASMRKGAGIAVDNAEGLALAVDEFLAKVSPERRRDLLFRHLLSPESVKIVVNGSELPLISDTGTAKTVMNEQLNDITYLLQIGAEVLKFNFERFFAFGKSTLSRK